ncbi:MAG: TonB-dependent receptor [Flammeovirgaceae bacterium]
MYKKLLIFLLAMVPYLAVAQSGRVKGKIVEDGTDEAMIGVTVLVKNTTVGGVTDLDGNFAIANIPVGNQTLEISYIGYETISLEVTIKADEITELGIIKLQSTSIGLDEIEVFANVVEDRKTPVAVSKIDNTVIVEQLGGMQLPEILNSTPGVYATKGSGAFADARINVRGFNQTETLFLINGVPLNDMESGSMFWSNFAGLSEITRNMEVQRGLGASKLGVNSVGGTINIITQPAEKRKGGRAEVMFGNGSWDNRYRLTLNSGKSDKGWAFTFQGSRTTGDGYFEGAYVDAWSYFLTASKEINKNHTLLFTLFGAPVNRGRVWSKTKDYYERFGSFQQNAAVGYFNGELLNASQNQSHKPQATLMHLWNINPKMFVTTSVYTSIARAYGTSIIDQTPGGDPLRDEDLSNDGLQQFEAMADANRANTQTINNPYGDPFADPIVGEQALYALEARYNNHNWYGVISNLNYEIDRNTSLVVGIDFRDYTARHYAEVHHLLGADFWYDRPFDEDPNILRPNNVAYRGDRINYDYEGNVRWGSVFLQAEKTMGKLDIFASLNLSRTQMWRNGLYWGGQSSFEGNSFGESDKRVFNNYNLKGGLNYRFNGRHNVFANAGVFTRAPFLINAFQNARYSNSYLPNLRDEEALAFELGYSYRSSKFRLNANAYYFKWNNKIFRLFREFDAGLDEFIYPSVVNGQEAIHQGIEVDFQLDVINGLQIRGAASLGDWEWASNANVIVTNNESLVIEEFELDAKGTPVGNAAQTAAFIGLHYKGIRNFYIGSFKKYFTPKIV